MDMVLLVDNVHNVGLTDGVVGVVFGGHNSEMKQLEV